MTISFTKMQALGNDFVIIDALNQAFTFSAQQIKALAHRHTGIGFDQMLIVQASNQADFFIRIYNADGSEAEQCGNGLRCAAYYLHEMQLNPSSPFILETKAGLFSAEILSHQAVKVELGRPTIIAKQTPLSFDTPPLSIVATIISMGNPHAIIRLNDASIQDNQKPLSPSLSLAQQIASHPIFPNGVNVGFMTVLSPTHIRLETFERGAGKTFACGSNACAAVAAGIANDWLASEVKVEFELGSVTVSYDENTKIMNLSGPAVPVFTGTVGL